MKTKNNQDLSLEQREFVREIVREPALFAENVLGLRLWDKEVEILKSIKMHRRTAIKACHAVGKTFTLAVAVLWWLARYGDGIVLTPPPTQPQCNPHL